MAITKEDKDNLVQLFKGVDIKAIYASQEEQKRKWYTFGAYDILRVACEIVLAYPEEEKEKVS